nr:hypothetical protein [uncultured Desulfobulbus sp.]
MEKLRCGAGAKAILFSGKSAYWQLLTSSICEHDEKSHPQSTGRIYIICVDLIFKNLGNFQKILTPN